MSQPLLEINDLHVYVEGTHILKGLNLTIEQGKVHAIMGPNGSGKSTLASVLAGNESYEITQGSIRYLGEDLLEMEADERAREGIFLAFQYPVEIPGVSTKYFLSTAVNAARKSRGEEELSPVEFIKLVKEKASLVELDMDLLNRGVNEGFSGGEKKRAEIFQLAMLNPRLAILDETDSGLDIDALRIVSEGVNKLREANRSFLVITHYQRLLNHILPDSVHVLMDGVITQSGGQELALKLEKEGYGSLETTVS